jgi:predicted transcriptional regulator
MLTLHRRGESVDVQSLTIEFKNYHPQELKQMGGPARLIELSNSTTGYAHYWTYLRIIQEAARQRKTLDLFSEGAQAVISADREGVNRKLKEIQAVWEKMYYEDNDLRQYIVHAKDLDKLPPVTWLIQGEIPERGLVVLYGPSGVGKSFLAIDYAERIAQTRSVLYVASEGQYGYPGRIAAWRLHNHMDVGHLNFFMREIALSEKQQREKFQKAIDDLRPKLIFIDTLAHCLLPGDENSTRDMGFFIEGCNALVKAFECAVVLIHHTGIEGQRSRGSSALPGAADVMIKLTGDDDIILIECAKSKDAKPFPTRYMKLLPVEAGEFGIVPCLIPTDMVLTGPNDALTNRQEKILKSLAETFEYGAGPAELEDVVNIPRGQIQKILGRLRKLGFVAQDGPKDPYRITDQGKVKIGLRPISQMTSRLLPDSSLTPPRILSQDRRDSSDSLKIAKFPEEEFDAQKGVGGVRKPSKPL